MAKRNAPVVENGIVMIPTDAEKLAEIRANVLNLQPAPSKETPVVETPVAPTPEVPTIPPVTSQDILTALRNDPGLAEAMRAILIPQGAQSAPRTRKAYDAGSATAVPSCRKSTQKAGFVELTFSEKPDEATRSILKSAGYRWSKFNKVWYGPGATLAGHATFGALVQNALVA